MQYWYAARDNLVQAEDTGGYKGKFTRNGVCANGPQPVSERDRKIREAPRRKSGRERKKAEKGGRDNLGFIDRVDYGVMKASEAR